MAGGCPRHKVKRAPSPVGRKQNSAPALRQSLSPKDREVLKLQERAWLKQRDKVRLVAFTRGTWRCYNNAKTKPTHWAALKSRES
jgi:hypothetical protein